MIGSSGGAAYILPPGSPSAFSFVLAIVIVVVGRDWSLNILSVHVLSPEGA